MITQEGPVEQRALTMVHRVRPGAAAALRQRLNALGDDVARQTAIPFARLERLHFLRWVVLDAAGDDRALLAFESNQDGDTSRFLQDLVDVARPALDAIYGACEGYPGPTATRPMLLAYLEGGAVSTTAFYIAFPGKTVDGIVRESRVRDALEGFLDADRGVQPATALAVRQRARAYLAAQGLDPLPPVVAPPPRWPDLVGFATKNPGWILAAGALVAVPLFPITIVAVAGYAYLRHLESTDPEDPIVRDPVGVTQVAEREDVQAQNQLTHVVDVKPGVFRRLLLRAVLFVIDALAHHRYNRGELGGIPTIHFARWALLDGGRRLLFFSNYDGTWESYLGDFIDKAHGGLTAVWSNTVGFPRSQNLVSDGALDEERFKSWTRAHQVKTDLWYSAYRDVTNADIRTNATICEGLHGEMSEDDARGWLSLFAGGPAPNPDAASDALGAVVPTIAAVKLALDDIQGVVLRGYGKHPRSCFVVARFGDPAKTGAWIESLGATAADALTGELRANVAFTAAGLTALGLAAETVGSFSREFQEGMAFGTRPRALGDEGDSAPEKWRWGGTTAASPPVHAIVFLYGQSPQVLDARVSAVRRGLIEAGGAVVFEQSAEMLPNRREHFGFADGIAQPAVMGFDEDAKGGEADLLAPGEFVFGYPNAYGKSPDAPTLAGADAAKAGLGPDGSAAGAFGRNGTYLVVRQLHQRVADFRAFARRTSTMLFPKEPPDAAAVRVMASCVGRWQDGTPLAISPDPPASPNDAGANAFSFADDPHGFRCPVTAHVRRANPRDSLGPTVEESKLVANRHRILRRGRSYGEFLLADKDDLAERGLFFVAVNANIARQFEFVQQTWIENRKFNGMHNDVDPLVGRPADGPGEATTFTVAQEPIRGRVVGMKAFVTLRGGGYFFAPGIAALRAIVALAKSGG